MKRKRLRAGPQARPTFLDPYSVFACTRTEEDRKAARMAVSLALTFHLFLFVVRFTGVSVPFLPENSSVSFILPIEKLPTIGSPRGKESPVSRKGISTPVRQFAPFPDPRPDDPEPLYQAAIDPVPEVAAEVGTVLETGDPTAPPGPGGHGDKGIGDGKNPSGSGPNGILDDGPGVTAPVLLYRSLPSYTEEARKARIEGVVVVECIVRKNGSVDTIKVIRSLGYGLDESAVKTIATKWRFRPGTRNGEPVDVRAHVEVFFRLF